MTNPGITQSQKRFLESIGALFSEDRKNYSDICLFLKSSSDIGVIRNGGRNGARFAPQSFMATFKKFTQVDCLSNWLFKELEVSSVEEEMIDFEKSQIDESKRISRHLIKDQRIIHLGGGHDHIYPLLKALSKDLKKVIVINIDAHADTRTDESYHSGTPFRQFANEFGGDFLIYQIGLHEFANSFSTLTPFERSQSNILWRKDISDSSIANLFNKITKEITEETMVVFSLDADALIGSEVPGVSAVNPGGLTSEELLMIWRHYSDLPLTHRPVLGIYELNPIYDSVSSFSMRTIASFVFKTFIQS